HIAGFRLWQCGWHDLRWAGWVSQPSAVRFDLWLLCPRGLSQRSWHRNDHGSPPDWRWGDKFPVPPRQHQRGRHHERMCGHRDEHACAESVLGEVTFQDGIEHGDLPHALGYGSRVAVNKRRRCGHLSQYNAAAPDWIYATRGMIPAVEKYLGRYAEPEIQSVRGLRRSFGHVIVIPAFDENQRLVNTLDTIPEGPLGDVLTVLVINAPENATPDVHSRSAQLIEELADRYRDTLPRDESGYRWFQHPRGALLCVDRTGARSLPAGQGVGLARKIGCDIALRLHVQGTIRPSWIHSTYADVQLPNDYFERTRSVSDHPLVAACLYPFWHRCEPQLALADAMRRYEIFLRYYVLGLCDAGSPYAFHTLGST